MLVDETGTWAIPRAGLKPAGDGDATSPDILWDDENVTAEAVEDILSNDKVFEHRMVAVDKRDEDGRVKTDAMRRSQPVRTRRMSKDQSQIEGGVGKRKDRQTSVSKSCLAHDGRPGERIRCPGLSPSWRIYFPGSKRRGRSI